MLPNDVGYQAEDKGVAFELVQKAGDEPIDIGSGFRHFSVAVPSIEGALQRAMNDGYEIVEGVDFEAGEVYIRVCFSGYEQVCMMNST